MPLQAESLLIPLFQMGAPKVIHLDHMTYNHLKPSFHIWGHDSDRVELRLDFFKLGTWVESKHSQNIHTLILSLGLSQVLLLQWTHLAELKWNVVELFSGAGNVSAAMRSYGKAVANFDKELGGGCMDINQPAGFLPAPEHRSLITNRIHVETNSNFAHICLPRLALWLVLCAGPSS